MSETASLGALQVFEEQYIPFPPFVAAKDAIEANLALFRETGLASHLLVLGESGTGKSSLCRWLGTQHPRRQLPDGDTVEALIVSVPPAATIAGIADQMLKELGEPCTLRMPSVYARSVPGASLFMVRRLSYAFQSVVYGSSCKLMF